MTEAKMPAVSRMPRDEAVRLGKEIYHKIVLPLVEGDHHGEFVAIDVDTRKWAVASTTRDAIDTVREQRPDAVNIFCERVGFRALHSFGGGSLRRID